LGAKGAEGNYSDQAAAEEHAALQKSAAAVRELVTVLGL